MNAMSLEQSRSKCLPMGSALRRGTEIRSVMLNNTRQGYVRKDTLKLAGFLFLWWRA